MRYLVKSVNTWVIPSVEEVLKIAGEYTIESREIP